MGGKKRKRAPKETANSDLPSEKKPRIDAEPGGHAISDADKNKLFLDKSLFARELTREDHERERLLYKLLGSEDVDDRLAAADVIISALFGGHGVPDGVLRRHLERRLFRGLTSGNNAARVGFSYVLAEILGQLFGEKDLATTTYPRLSFDKLLEMLVEQTQTSGNVTGQEERDHAWGYLFGLETFIKSGVLFRDSSRWEGVLDRLLTLAAKKIWIRPQVAFVIARALPQMSQKPARQTLEKIVEAAFAKTPEGLGIWLSAADAFPDMKLPKPWKHPLASKSLQDVATVLRGSGKDASNDGSADFSEGARQGNTTVQLPFVWDMIIQHFLKSKDSEAKEFRIFWDRTVDQGYFAKGASDHQKLTGFKIFQKGLKDGAAQGVVLPGLFSKNLMSCLLNQAFSSTPRLHRAAVQCLKGIEKQVEAAPEILVSVLQQLLGENGTFNFDERVKGTGDGTKTIDKILPFTTPANAVAVIGTLRSCALQATNAGDDQKSLQILAEYLSRLATRPASASESDLSQTLTVAGPALQELVEIAHPKPGSKYPAPNGKTRDAVQKYFLSTAALLLKRADGFPQLCQTILSIDPDTVPMSSDIKTEVMSALKRLKKLLKKKDDDSTGNKARHGLAVLHAVSILQLYNDPKADALQVLSDTGNCFEKMQDKKHGSDSGLAEILVEVLLSMLAVSSQLTRQASLQVFSAFSSSMSAPALEYLTEILAAEENSSGFKALFSNDDEDEDMNDVEEISAEEVDDDEASSGGDEDDDESSPTSGRETDSSEEDSGSSDDEVDDASPDQEPAGLEAALMKAYKVSHTLDKDAEAESSDDDLDMSDSEMLAMDEQLSGHMKLLKSSTNTKKQRDDEKKKVVEFKHRVLDLLEVYVKEEAPKSNPLVLSLLPPAVLLAKRSKEPSLCHKAIRIITEAQKLLKKSRANSVTAEVEVESAVSLLEEIHEAANDPTESKAFAAAVSAASLAIASTLFAVDKENYRRIADVYRRTQDGWVLEGVNVRTSIFTDWYNWCQALRVQSKTAAATTEP